MEQNDVVSRGTFIYCGMDFSGIVNRSNKSNTLAEYISSDYVSSMSVLSARDIVAVYVEGWDDVAFWRNIFDDFSESGITFEIMPPVRSDMAKGKKVVLDFINNSGPHLFLAVDSDFDWIFDGRTHTSSRMKNCKWLVQTYAYAIENLQCAVPSLSSVLSKATRIDLPVFDFVLFFENYSKSIFDLFVWYVWSAFVETSHTLPLSKFSNAVRIPYIDFRSNGKDMLEAIARSASKLYRKLCAEYPEKADEVVKYSDYLHSRGILETETIYYMQGHTLKDCVVKKILIALSEKIIEQQVDRISSTPIQKSLKENQINYYRNSTKPVEQILSENQGYKKTKFYASISERINYMIANRHV